MWKQGRPAVLILAVMTVISGVLYPLLVTCGAKWLFPHQADGSLIERDGRTVGSELIGQPFDDSGYFWGRLSATNPCCNGAASGGSNLGPLNRRLAESAKARADALHRADPGNTAPIPVDLVTASGSGLDPHISVAAAMYQVPRVARARGMEAARLIEAVLRHIEDRQLGVLGEKRVNVLKLNLSLKSIE